MTRTVPEGEHFQDLRFWDSNQIGADRDTQPPAEDIAEQFQRYYSDTQAFAASSADQILISCRGTSEWIDWLRDLAAYTTAFPYGPPSFGDEPAQVHAGFFGAFAFLQPYVEAYLNEFLPKTDENGDPTGEQKQVVVCGHSLGGAIGLLIAAYIRSEHTANVMLYTYGMPPY
jgi:predicted lipase